jgi:plastocyanin
MAANATLTATAASAGTAQEGARRSTAMWALPTFTLIEIVLMLDVLRQVIIPPVIVFGILMSLALVAMLLRPGWWTYLAGGIVFILFTLGNGAILIDGIVHPLSGDHQWKEMVAIVLGVAGSVAGMAAFVEARGSAALLPPLRSPLGEAGVVLVAGALLGGTVISLAAYAQAQAAPTAGIANGVTSAPTQAPVELTAEGAKFVQHQLLLAAGAGTVYVVNKDNAPHTFDFDNDGKHYSYPIPAHTTVAVVTNLKASRYTYWCALSGHRSNGMEGTLVVQ